MTKGLSPVPPQHFQSPLSVPQDRAVYRIKAGKFFGPDDTLYQEGSVIAFDDEPNMEMEPLNGKAMERMKTYLSKLDDEGRKAAEKVGKGYTSLADAFENAQLMERENAKRVQLINGRQVTPLLGGSKKGNSKIAKIELDAPVPLMGTQGSLSVTPQTGRQTVNDIMNSGL